MTTVPAPWRAAALAVVPCSRRLRKRSDQSAREVVTIADSNTHTMEMYGPEMNGQEVKVMEITYTRKGAKPAPR